MTEHYLETEIEPLINSLIKKGKNELKKLHLDIFNTKPLFDVELSTLCNIKCNICPREKITRKMGIMTDDTFDILAHWIPDGCNLMLCGLGEPLMNPKVPHFIKKIKKRNIKTAITTNGLMLTPQIVDELLDSKIDMIQISVNGFSQKTYDKICSKANFNTLIENLKSLSNESSKSLKKQITVIEQNENEKDLPKLKQFANENGFSFFLRRTHSRGGYLYKPEQYVNFDGCGLFIKAAFITWEGNVLSCCQDLSGENCLGNIKNIKYEDLIEQKKIFIENYKWFEICRNCDDLFSRYVLLANPSCVD